MKKYLVLMMVLFATVAHSQPIGGGPVSGGGSVSSYADVVKVFGSGSCSGYLKSDGTCDTPAGTGDVVGPGSTTQYKIPYWAAGAKTLIDGIAFPVVATTNAMIYATAAGTYTSLPVGAAGAVLMASTAASPVPVYKSTINVTVGGFTASVVAVMDSTGNLNVSSVTAANLLKAAIGPATATTYYLPKFSTSGGNALSESGISENGTDVDLAALNLVTTGTISGQLPSVALGVITACTMGVSCDTNLKVARGGVMAVGTLGKYILPVKVTNYGFCFIAVAAHTYSVGAQGSDFIVIRNTQGAAAGAAYFADSMRGNKICFWGSVTDNEWVVTSHDNGATAVAVN